MPFARIGNLMTNNPVSQELAEQLTRLVEAYRKPGSDTSAAFALRSHLLAHVDTIIRSLTLTEAPEPLVARVARWLCKNQGYDPDRVLEIGERGFTPEDEVPQWNLWIEQAKELAALSSITTTEAEGGRMAEARVLIHEAKSTLAPFAVKSARKPPEQNANMAIWKLAKAIELLDPAALGEVVQADRNAAVRLLEAGGQDWQAKEIHIGNGDHFPIVQAFRDHRIASQPSEREGWPSREYYTEQCSKLVWVTAERDNLRDAVQSVYSDEDFSMLGQIAREKVRAALVAPQGDNIAAWREMSTPPPKGIWVIGKRDPMHTGRAPAFVGKLYKMRENALLDEWSGRWAVCTHWAPLPTALATPVVGVGGED
jgi:hypothetical protein